MYATGKRKLTPRPNHLGALAAPTEDVARYVRDGFLVRTDSSARTNARFVPVKVSGVSDRGTREALLGRRQRIEKFAQRKGGYCDRLIVDAVWDDECVSKRKSAAGVHDIRDISAS